MTRVELEALLEQLPMPAVVLQGGRVCGVNARLEQVTGVSREEYYATVEPFSRFVDPRDLPTIYARISAIARGEKVPDEVDYLSVGREGARIPCRARVGEFPAAGAGARILLISREDQRERAAFIIRGFVDVAVAAQAETTEAGVLAAVRAALAARSLHCTFFEVEGDRFRFAPGPALSALGAELRQRLPSWIPLSHLPVPSLGEGAFLADVPTVLAELLGRPRKEFDERALPHGMLTPVHVEGRLRYLMHAGGIELDAVTANAFGLLGKQVGAALEMARRLEQLARSNRELSALNEIARIGGSLEESKAPGEALHQLVRALSLASAALLRADGQRLSLLAAHGEPPPFEHGSPAERAARQDATVLFAPGGRALPLRVEGVVNGVLLAAREEPFTPDEDLLLATASAQLAVHLHNAALLGELRARVLELSLLLDLGQQVLGTLDLREVLEIAARTASQALRVSCAYVMLPREDGNSLRQEAAFDPDGAQALEIPLGTPSLTTLAFKTREPQVSSNTGNDPRIDPALAEGLRCRATLALPLLSHDRALGVLLLFDRAAHSFSPDQQRLAAHVAQLVAAALESAELFARERRRADEMALLQDLSQATSGKLNRDELLEVALTRLVHVLRADIAAVYLETPQGLTHVASRARGPGTPQMPDLVPRGAPLSLLAELSSRMPGILRCHATPLAAGGALLLCRAQDNEFGDDERRLAAAVAAQLSVALDNARLYAAERARAEEMSLLLAVTRKLGGGLELRPLLADASEALRGLAGVSRCAVLLHDEVLKRLRPVTLRGAAQADDELLLKELTPALGSLSERAFLSRMPVQESGFALALSLPHELAEPGMRAALAVPLLARDRALGVVVLSDGRERHFSQAEIERVAAVCNQLALAVLSAQLYEDLRNSYAELARTQRELIDREQLAALGELSASIAHEVRNPLGVIFNAISSLRRLTRRDAPDATVLIDIVEEEADRLNRMVGDLLDYSRPVQPAIQPFPFHPLFEEALAASRQQAGCGHDIVVQMDVPPDFTIRGDARLLRQALVNLLNNALQAMPRGGHLRVHAAQRTDAAEIHIADTGPGIPDDIRGRIFQPFFTTKATGTGLGLAVVRRIIEGHGGSVTAVGHPHGAEFILVLPSVAE